MMPSTSRAGDAIDLAKVTQAQYSASALPRCQFYPAAIDYGFWARQIRRPHDCHCHGIVSLIFASSRRRRRCGIEVADAGLWLFYFTPSGYTRHLPGFVDGASDTHGELSMSPRLSAAMMIRRPFPRWLSPPPGFANTSRYDTENDYHSRRPPPLADVFDSMMALAAAIVAATLPAIPRASTCVAIR